MIGQSISFSQRKDLSSKGAGRGCIESRGKTIGGETGRVKLQGISFGCVFTKVGNNDDIVFRFDL